MLNKINGSVSASVTLGALLTAIVLALGFVPFSDTLAKKKEEPPEETYDGLKRVQDSKVALAYVKPNADFSAYSKLLITDCYVAFKKNWQRDQNRDRTMGSRRISDTDMERIKGNVAQLFRDVFVEELDAEGGYQVVDEPGEDVLLIRPAIIDLDITAPDTMQAGRSRTYVSSAGAATLYIELYDSVSGEILARAVDRKAGRDYGRMQWSSSVSNSAEAKRVLRRWAGLLRQGLDEVHGKES